MHSEEKWWQNRFVRLVGFGLAFWFALFATFFIAAILDRFNSGQDVPYSRLLISWAVTFGHWIFLVPPIRYFTTQDRFVDASLAGKFVQTLLLLAGSAVVVIGYFYVVAAPAYGQEFLPFITSFQYVQWIWDFVLFGIVIMFGYQSVVKQRTRMARLEAAELGQQVAEQQRDLSAREAEYLRGRLGSHFVMNALSNLVGLMRLGQVRRAEEATILLSDILRSMTGASGGDECITLEEEIEDAKKYLEFQQIRFPNLTARYEVAAEARTVEVPRQILQPLLENVFKHGPRGGDITIQVSASVAGDILSLSISNKLKGQDGNITGEGEGIVLTKLRLEMAFGAFATVQRTNDQDQYTVTLFIPAGPRGENE